MNKLVIALTAIVFLILGFIIAKNIPNQATATQVLSNQNTLNSYALFQGNYEVLGNVDEKISGMNATGIFKINTQTGDTWLFSYVIVDGVILKRWIPINGLPEKWYIQLMSLLNL